MVSWRIITLYYFHFPQGVLIAILIRVSLRHSTISTN